MELLQRLGERVAVAGRASVAFSGGSTPKLMFAWMARQPFDWSRIEIFWVDERCVLPTHEDSNFRMTREALLDHIQPAGVHRILGELPPVEAAVAYENEIVSVLGADPRFDVIHLGMGADAHIASLFPGVAEIDSREGTTAAVWVPKLNAHRVTLLPKPILNANHIVMLVTGTDKSSALEQVMSGPYNPAEYPAQLVDRNASAIAWFTDVSAKGGGFSETPRLS